MMLLFAIIAGFVLDLLIGDPRWLPHPICLIGNLISFLEKLLRSVFGKTSRGLLAGGAVLVVLVLAFSFCIPFLLLAWAEELDPWLAFAMETFMCYQIFATRCLREESMKVYTALKNNDLTDARMKLSWIVGRDTKELTNIKGQLKLLLKILQMELLLQCCICLSAELRLRFFIKE